MRKNIVLVEDEPDLAENYREILEYLGYEVLANFDSALATLDYLHAKKPDLMLIDIKIKGEKNGIELARVIQRDYGIPIIFTTAYSNDATLEQAFESAPINYLVKPITLENFKTALYLAFNTRNSLQVRPTSKKIKIRSKGYVFYLAADEVVFLKADGLYTTFITMDDTTFLERGVLKDVHKLFPEDQFIRVHKSYVINLRFVKSFNSKHIELLTYKIPMRRGYYNEFKSFFEDKLDL